MKPGDLVQLLPDSNIAGGFGVPSGALGKLMNIHYEGEVSEYWHVSWILEQRLLNVYARYLKVFEEPLEFIADLNEEQRNRILTYLPEFKKEFIGGA